MDHLKKVVKIVVNILTVILLIILSIVIYGKCSVSFFDKSYPNYFGYTIFEVASGSMKPTLNVNDVIIVKIGNDRLQKDDIIAFKSDKSIVTHRIIFIDSENDVLTVKGDNNNTIDKPINKGQVIGHVVKVLPKLGVWKKVVAEPKILAVIFVTLLAFDFALSYENTTGDLKFNDEDDEVKKEVKTRNEIKKEEKVVEKSKVEKKEEKPKKDIIKKEKLLELTRKIDLSEINALLEDEKLKLSDTEMRDLKKEINKISFSDDYVPELRKKQKKFVEYTLRLDLNGIQKKIKQKVK